MSSYEQSSLKKNSGVVRNVLKKNKNNRKLIFKFERYPGLLEKYNQFKTGKANKNNSSEHIKDKKTIKQDIEDGFEDDFINKICYTGEINNEDNDNYKLIVPDIAEVDKNKVYQNLKELALKCMSNRN